MATDFHKNYQKVVQSRTNPKVSTRRVSPDAPRSPSEDDYSVFIVNAAGPLGRSGSPELLAHEPQSPPGEPPASPTSVVTTRYDGQHYDAYAPRERGAVVASQHTRLPLGREQSTVFPVVLVLACGVATVVTQCRGTSFRRL